MDAINNIIQVSINFDKVIDLKSLKHAGGVGTCRRCCYMQRLVHNIIKFWEKFGYERKKERKKSIST